MAALAGASRGGHAPFAPGTLSVVLPRPELAEDPDERAFLEELPRLLAEDAPHVARELGAEPVVVDAAPAEGPVWFIGPAALNPDLLATGHVAAEAPVLALDRERRRLISDAPTVAGVRQTFAMLRSLHRHPGGPLPVGDCADTEEAITRVIREVADTWPSFGLRGVDWPAVCRRHLWRVRGATNPVVAIQRWLAELGDFHTWLRPVWTSLVLPYGACVVDGEVVITHVLDWTAGWAAGLRPGFRLVGEDVRGTWETTPGSPHARPLLVARRILSGRAGEERVLEARGPRGEWVRWRETFEPPTGTPASWTVLPSGVGYLWIGAWVPDYGVEEVIEEALTELRTESLVVDLRGNAGGRLAMAQAFRDRFLDRPRTMGFIRYTRPGGGLGPAEPLQAEPSDGVRWTRPVRFLTSPLSWSSAEDAILGLQGLPNVQVFGEPSGGGSGRIRRMRLLPGWRLTVSQALTYDRNGHCVEGAGVPVDRLVVPDRRHPDGSDPVLWAAEQGW